MRYTGQNRQKNRPCNERFPEQRFSLEEFKTLDAAFNKKKLTNCFIYTACVTYYSYI